MIEVTNQPPPLENHNPLTSETVLAEALAWENAGWAVSRMFGCQGSIATEFSSRDLGVRHPVTSTILTARF